MKRGDPSRYYYCVENSNLDGPDFTLAETELVLKLAELHAQCATEAGQEVFINYIPMNDLPEDDADARIDVQRAGSLLFRRG